MSSPTDPPPLPADAPDGSGGAEDRGADLPPDGPLRLLEISALPEGTFAELEPTTPPLVDAQGRVRLSFSRVDTYQNCPRRFRYDYIDRLPTAPSPHLSFGSSIHRALEWFYDRKVPEPPSEEQLVAFLYDSWDSRGFQGRPREEQVSFYRHAQEVLRRFHRRATPSFRLPAATEAWFELPIGYDAVVVGSIDRVDVDDDGAFHVIDYKTNRKVKDRARVAGSLQLALYALACRHLFGSLPVSVSLDFVVPGVEVRVPLEDLDLDAARAAVLATAQAIRDQRFAPTPNPLCDWCDHRSICPAWPDDGREGLGTAVAELRRRQREVTREVRELRELEAGVQRLAEELAADDPDQPTDDETQPPAE